MSRDSELSNSSLAELTENSPVAILKMDEDGVIVYANRKAEEVFGRGKNEITGLTYGEVNQKIVDTDGNDLPEAELPFELVRDRGEAVNNSRHAVLNERGERKTLSLSANPLFDEEGELSGLVCAIEDVTGTAEPAGKITGSESRHRKKVENMSSGLVVYEPVNNGEDFLIRNFNEAAEEIEGASRQDVIDKKVTEVFPSIRESGLFAVLQSVNETGEPEKHRVSIHEDDRIESWRENYVYKLSTGEVVAVHDDITERKKVERTREKLLYELDERYKELNLLYQVTELAVDSEMPLSEILRKATELIPMSWQYPEATCARIIYGDDEFRTDRFEITELKQTVTLEVEGEEIGRIEVYYLKEKTSMDEGPFLEEEQDLLESLSGILGQIISQRRVEKRKEHLNSVLRSIKYVKQLLVEENDRDSLIQGICDNLVETRGYGHVWIAIFDESEELDRAAQAGLGEDFEPMREALEVGELPYCVRNTLDQSEIVTTRNPSSNYGECPLMGCYGENGALSKRIEHKGRVYGLLSASVPINYIDDVEEQELFEEVAGDIAFGLHDIEAERALKESEHLFEYAYDAIIFSHFETGEIFEVNPEAEKLLGFSSEELLQKKLYDLFEPGDYPNLRDQLESDGFFLREDQALEKKDGSRVIASMSSSLVDFRGERTILTLLQDMTKRVQLEKELRERARSLKKSNERLEDMIQIISHDLKEPLRSIGAYSDMLFKAHREELHDSSFRRLRDLKENATRLNKMLDEVSSLAHVTASSSPEKIEVPGLIEEIQGELGITTAGAEIEVRSDFPEIKFDRFQFKVLLKNLLSNSIKYNSPPVKIELGYNKLPERGKLEVLVRDNGIGIAEEHHDRVFKMFEQLEPDESSSGTGTGLALSKRIVEESGEEIWLDSRPGEGTTVGFTVPAGKDVRIPEDFFDRLSASSLDNLTPSQKERSEVIDEETGLYNRQYLDRILAGHLKDYCREGEKVRFLLIAFSGYGEIESKYGPEQMSGFRRKLSARLKRSIRGSDLLLRFSEERFLLVLPKMAGELRKVKDRISSEVVGEVLLDDPYDSTIAPVFGASLLDPSSDCDPEKAIAEAEKNLQY